MIMSSLNTNYPPVTVYVITYNSSDTVVETLESIKEQTYQNIGLIVSDDCSTDDTVNICSDWMRENRSRFTFTQMITTSQNTGVSGNVNRALDACKTNFCKGIAGDDKLLPECVSKNVDFMMSHPDSVAVFSKVKIVGEARYVRKYVSPFDYSFFSLCAKEQNQRLREKGNCVPAASVFFRIDSLRNNGIRCDERIPMLDDLPLWCNLTERGIKLDFFDDYTVGYRVGPGSLTTSRLPHKTLVSGRLFRLYYVFEKEYQINKDKAIEKLAEEEVSMLEGSLDYQVGSRILKPFRRIDHSSFWRFLLIPLKRYKKHWNNS